MTTKTEPKAIVGRTLTGYDRPVTKDATQSILEQLASLGYCLLTGTARFHAAMSLGLKTIAQDQVGSPVMISCENGILSIAPASTTTRPVAAFQVHRIHLAN